MPRRVLHITNIPTPYRIPQLNEMSRQFERAGWTLNVAFGGTGYGRRKWEVDLEECVFPYEILDGRVALRNDGGRAVFLYRGLYRVIRAFDPHVVLVTGFSLAAARLALLSCLGGPPFLIFSGSTGRGARRIPPWRALQRKLLARRAAGGVAYGSWALEHLVSLGVAREHVHVAINTVDVEYFHARATASRALRTADPVKTLLHVGNLARGKRVDILLRLTSRLRSKGKDVRLVLVGDGPERHSLERMAKELGIEGHVQFEGFRQKHDIPDYLSRADCFLFPTHYDIWGLVLNEAMAAGLPCLASVEAGATRDLIEDGVTGFAVDFDDLDGIERRVEWILDRPDEAARVGAAGSAFVRREASIERSAAGFVDAVVDVADRAVDHVERRNARVARRSPADVRAQ
jgi:glycosyltransferase involved in cell wall biosynthesis